MSDPIPYDPNCLHCRRDAGKDSASVTRLCEAHKDAQLAAFQPYLKDGETPIERLERERHDLAEAREKLTEREATVDILVQRVHERDAELGELKQSGKTERRFTNDYIKALHKAERERDEALAEIERLRIKHAARHAGAEEEIAMAQRERDKWRDKYSNLDIANTILGALVQALTRERDEALTLLAEVREWHRCPWKHGASVKVIDLQRHAEWIARLDAALKDT